MIRMGEGDNDTKAHRKHMVLPSYCRVLSLDGCDDTENKIQFKIY